MRLALAQATPTTGSPLSPIGCFMAVKVPASVWGVGSRLKPICDFAFSGADHGSQSRPKVVCVFGTRPEVIKLAPVIQELQFHQQIRTLTVNSGQHTGLLDPLLTLFHIRPDFNLQVMQQGQSPGEVCSRVMAGLGPIIEAEHPDLIVVQGDTTTAVAAALVGFYQKVAVAHVEAGLRSGDPDSPFPEEMNRRLISQLSTYHFAATAGNRHALLQEGVSSENIFVTGNPVVDSLAYIFKNSAPSESVRSLLARVAGKKLIVLTTHRRESFGRTMRQNLAEIRQFVESHEDVALVFPVHPNPNVAAAARAELDHGGRVLLIEPLDYANFVQLLRSAWLLLSDSGGIQEEAPTLGKMVFVLRNNTERPEAIESGVAQLVGNQPGRLTAMLQRAYSDGGWLEQAKLAQNPFGDGTAGKQIVEVLCRVLAKASQEHGVSA